jgi:hypothetical protein
VSRWLQQTKAGGGHLPPEQRGDCVPACIASILGLPLSAIANTHGEGWWDQLQAEVAKHGYGLALVDMRFAPPPGLWIASLPSLNLPTEPDVREAWHSIICRGYEFVHDPSLGKQYDSQKWAEAWSENKVAEGWVLAPLDPAEQAA